MSDARFSSFLEQSFAALRDEIPGALTEMCRSLQRRAVLLTVDGERVALRFGRASATIVQELFVPDIEVRTDAAAILDLVDARCTLHEAILTDRLFLRGTPDELLAFHGGLMAYLHGAMRAPSFPHLLRRYRVEATRLTASGANNGGGNQ